MKTLNEVEKGVLKGGIEATAANLARYDMNGDGRINVSDVSYLTNYLYLGGDKPKCSADTNGDGRTDITDVLNLVRAVFGTA